MTGLSLVSLLAAAPVWWVSRGLAPSIALVPVFIAYTLLYLVGAGLLGWPELKRWYPRAGAKTDDRSG
jgi:hypothetical protein